MWKAPKRGLSKQPPVFLRRNGIKPAPDRWSVAEVTEHIAAAEDFLMGMVTGQVMKAPPRPAGDDVQALDEMVLAKVPDRSNKAQAPEPLKPTNRFGSPEGSLKH